MAKTILVKGDYVVAKKWSGEEFLGVYEYHYEDGEHCIMDVKTHKRFCAHKGDVKLANEEQEKNIKQMIKENKLIIKKMMQQEEENELEDALAAID